MPKKREFNHTLIILLFVVFILILLFTFSTFYNFKPNIIGGCLHLCKGIDIKIPFNISNIRYGLCIGKHFYGCPPIPE